MEDPLSDAAAARRREARRRWSLAAVIGAAALAGCTSGKTSFETTQFGGHYQSVAFEFVAGGRDFHTVVVGNPVGGDDDAFAKRVTTILRERNTLQPSNFTTEPDADAWQPFRLVMVFDPARRMTPNTLCRDPESLATAAPDPQRITMHGAYCNGAVAVTSLRGSVAGGDDAAFEQFLAEALLHLFPQRGLGDGMGVVGTCPGFAPGFPRFRAFGGCGS